MKWWDNEGPVSCKAELCHGVRAVLWSGVDRPKLAV